MDMNINRSSVYQYNDVEADNQFACDVRIESGKWYTVIGPTEEEVEHRSEALMRTLQATGYPKEVPTGKRFWYFSLYEAKDGDSTRMIMRRTSRGFNAHELLGVLEGIKQELLDTIKGEGEEFDVFERSIIKESDDVSR